MIDSDYVRSPPALNITQEALQIAQIIAPTITQEEDLKAKIEMSDCRTYVPDYISANSRPGVNVADVHPKQPSVLSPGFSSPLVRNSTVKIHAHPTLVRDGGVRNIPTIRTSYHRDPIPEYIPAYHGSARKNEIDDSSQNSCASPYGNYLMQNVFGNAFSSACSPSSKSKPNLYDYIPSYR